MALFGCLIRGLLLFVSEFIAWAALVLGSDRVVVVCMYASLLLISTLQSLYHPVYSHSDILREVLHFQYRYLDAKFTAVALHHQTRLKASFEHYRPKCFQCCGYHLTRLKKRATKCFVDQRFTF